MSWDPKLVSKEIRLLDHTISMYSLVHVCTFCSQFFDPDFPDGIAYPVRVDSPVRACSIAYLFVCAFKVLPSAVSHTLFVFVTRCGKNITVYLTFSPNQMHSGSTGA
jgi:hypothetical protein